MLECVKAGDTEYMAMILSTQLFDRINMGRTEIYALLEFLWPFTGNLLKISEVKLHIFEYYVCIACQVMKSEGNEKSTVKA